VHTYVGGVCALLALFAVLRCRRDPLVRTHVVLLVVAMMIAFGRFTPVYHLVLHAPAMRFVRVPARALTFAFFSIVALAARGGDALTRDARHAIAGWRALVLWTVLAAVALPLVANVALRLGDARLVATLTRRLEAKYVAESQPGDAHAHASERALELRRQLATRPIRSRRRWRPTSDCSRSRHGRSGGGWRRRAARTRRQ
jgi:hypothetical protein